MGTSRPLLLSLATLGLITATAASAQTPAPGPELQPDCNGNGVADLLDIRSGTSQDCQRDGIPDECQVDEGFRYLYGDGVMDGAVGTDHDYICWLTEFTVQPGHETITDVEIGWGLMDPGSPGVLCLWSDPNGDGDPADAQLLVSIPVFSDLEFTGQIVREDLPDTVVGSAGDSFFVGIYGQFQQSWFPAGLDDDSLDRRSWFISSDTPINPDDLTSGAIAEYGLLGSLCGCDGDWFLRPIACQTGHCAESSDVNSNGIPDECEPDCNSNGLPDDYEITNGLAIDCDGDGIIDECEIADDPGLDCNGDLLIDSCQVASDPSLDCNGNGILDACDLLADPSLDCDGNLVIDSCQASSQGLVGEYFPNKNLMGAPISRIDAQVFFDFDIDPLPAGIPDDGFSVRWTGSITTGAAGLYGFGVLHDDGARLWVNGRRLVERWENSGGDFDEGFLELAASTEYHIRLEYFENSGGARAELYWQIPGGTMQPMSSSELSPIYDRTGDGIPDVCQLPDCNGNGVEDSEDIVFGNSIDCDGNTVPDECQPCEDADYNGWLDTCEAASGNGLVGQYFTSNGEDGRFGSRVFVRIDPTIDFDWGTGSPGSGMPDDSFAVRWTGALAAIGGAGTYTFHVRSDDGVRFWLDGQLLVDEWKPSAGTEYDVDVVLAAGQEVLLEVEYYEAGGDAKIFLSWTPPGGAKEIVPTAALTVSSDLDGDGVPDLATADCNLNGIPDSLETDLNGNCIPDDCEGGSGYWRFEEAGGPTVIDATGNGGDGTLNALPDRTTEVPVDPIPGTGAPNTQSLHLNWVDTSNGGLVRVPDAGGFLTGGGSSFTLEAWVKLDHVSDTSGADQRQWLCQKKPTGTPDTQLDYSVLVQAGNLGPTGRELAFRWGDGASSSGVWSNLRIEDTEWHFVSVSYDVASRNLRFGLDGAFELISIDRSGFANTGELVIGGHESGSGVPNHFMRGSIDEFRMTRAYLAPELLLDSE